MKKLLSTLLLISLCGSTYASQYLSDCDQKSDQLLVKCKQYTQHGNLTSQHNLENINLEKYHNYDAENSLPKQMALFFNTNTDNIIDRGGALLNIPSMSFQEVFLKDKKISYLIITRNDVITDTLQVPEGVDYSYNLQTNLKENYQSVISLGIYYPKEEYYKITKLLGVNSQGKLIDLNLSTTIYDCPTPNKYITDSDSGNYTFGIKNEKRYKRFWNEISNTVEIPNNWLGKYSGINKKSKDWREEKTITLYISKNSIIFEMVGYQMLEKYLLTGKVVNNNLLLTYAKTLDGYESDVLKKTKDFGKIYFDGKKYLWESPYLNVYNDKKYFILKKIK